MKITIDDCISLESLVAFCVLMENNSGILGKAPSYIEEKFTICRCLKNTEELEKLLDHNNRKKFNEYIKIWFKNEDDENVDL